MYLRIQFPAPAGEGFLPSMSGRIIIIMIVWEWKCLIRLKHYRKAGMKARAGDFCRGPVSPQLVFQLNKFLLFFETIKKQTQGQKPVDPFIILYIDQATLGNGYLFFKFKTTLCPAYPSVGKSTWITLDFFSWFHLAFQ